MSTLDSKHHLIPPAWSGIELAGNHQGDELEFIENTFNGTKYEAPESFDQLHRATKSGKRSAAQLRHALQAT